MLHFTIVTADNVYQRQNSRLEQLVIRATTAAYLMRIADGRRFGWYFSFQPEFDVELSTLAQICTVSHIKLDDIIIVTKIVPCKVSSGFRLGVLGHSTKFIALLA